MSIISPRSFLYLIISPQTFNSTPSTLFHMFQSRFSSDRVQIESKLDFTDFSVLHLCLPFSSKWTASGGRGSTMSVSRSSSAFTRRREDSGASRPWTTWPRLPAGLCLDLRNKVSTQSTRGSNGGTKPKTFQDAESQKKRHSKECYFLQKINPRTQ